MLMVGEHVHASKHGRLKDDTSVATGISDHD